MNSNIFKNKKTIILLLLAVLAITFFIDKGLFVGLGFISIISSATFYILDKFCIGDKKIYLLLSLVLITHFTAVLLIYYFNFQPFSGHAGDYIGYHKSAVEMAQRFRSGDFFNLINTNSGQYSVTYYPVVIGFLYAITMSKMIIGQLFGAWLAMITALFIYLLVREIGGTWKQSFAAGLIVNFYPSYLFYGSLLLKDTIIVPLAIGGVLLTVRLIKKFSWSNFAIFCLIMLALTHFRFYVGYAGLIAYIFCWPIFSKMENRKKIMYSILTVLLLGFIPFICGDGYFGYKPVQYYISPKQISNYRENFYEDAVDGGTGSTISIQHNLHSPIRFLFSYSETFLYTVFGPFPWQIKFFRQLFGLAETLPWYILVFFIIKGIKNLIKKYNTILPLILFSAIVLSVLALFTPNYGIITRIRIPAFLALICFVPFGFDFKNKYIDKFNNCLEKISDRL